MKLVANLDSESLTDAALLAESGEFAIYGLGNETYALVHRHEGVEWQAITFSGDGLFRVSELLVIAGRSVYRDVAATLSVRNNNKG